MKHTDKEKRILSEYRKLSREYEGLPGSDRILADMLIQNAAFLTVTLQDLQRDILTKGPVDTYQNGANQYGTKASAELQAYNQSLKSYCTVQKRLSALLPRATDREEAQEYTITWDGSL